MNFKKIAITAAAAGVMLASAMPALAVFHEDGDGDGGLNLVVVKNWDTNVTNNVWTKANTGFNAILAHDDVDGGSINTGNAGAASVVSNMVNTNIIDLCGCLDGDFNIVFIKNKETDVTNNVWTKANTGFNLIGAHEDVDGGSINTGNAGAAGVVTNVVNTNVVGGSSPF